jgi:hypothetical protein
MQKEEVFCVLNLPPDVLLTGAMAFEMESKQSAIL